MSKVDDYKAARFTPAAQKFSLDDWERGYLNCQRKADPAIRELEEEVDKWQMRAYIALEAGELTEEDLAWANELIEKRGDHI
jgi:hypothetical protein